MAVPLDPLGNVTLSLQIVILFLLIIGLPLIRGRNDPKNIKRHGYLTALALLLHTILIFLVMIPSFDTNLQVLNTLSISGSILVWSHVILGALAEIAGIILVAPWLYRSPSKMTCAKYKKWMTPVFTIWAISLINGAAIHILGTI